MGALNYDDRVLIERYVPGRELAVTVLGPAEEPDVLPVIEIETEEPFYTFRAHYDPGAATMREADLDDATRERVEQVAAQAYRAAGCRDLGRVDLILDESSTPQMLEINTIPGLTETGPTRYAAQAAGMDFTDLIAPRDLARHAGHEARHGVAQQRARHHVGRVVHAEIRARQRHGGRHGVERRARQARPPPAPARRRTRSTRAPTDRSGRTAPA